MGLGLFLGWGCGSDGAVPTAEPDGAPEVEVAPGLPDIPDLGGDGACTTDRAQILRVAPWVGGGLQLTVALTDEDGAPATAPLGANLSLRDAGGEPLSLAVSPVGVPEGITGIVLLPDPDPAVHQARVAEAQSLLDGLEPAERVALWSAGAAAVLHADLTTRHQHVAHRLAQIPSEEATWSDALAAELQGALASVEGPWGAVHRALLVVDGSRGGADMASDLALRRGATIRVGACPSGGSPWTLETPGSTCTIEAPDLLADFAGLPCDPGAAAEDQWPYGDAISFSFTADERAVYEQLYADRDESDFALHVRVGPSAPMEATAHIRGQTSLDCARKSYTVNLAGPEARRLGPGAASDEFMLISLCLDRGYFRQVLSNRAISRHGLFPLAHRYVTLLLDGEDRGVYLLLEKPKETLREDRLAVTAIIRRRFDPTGKPEDVKYPPADPAAAEALAVYEAMTALVDTADSEALEGLLDARIDLDAHLKWLAFHTYFENGDYVDEVYFYASREGADPDAPWYFRTMGWDSDDLFSVCHHGGQYASLDPHGIAYCLEGDLDRAIFQSGALYDRFLVALEAMMTTELSPAEVTTMLGQVRADLMAHFDDEATCLAMVEADVASCAELEAHVDGEMAGLLTDLAARKALLMNAIDLARGSEP